jgi:hypothetical protein
VPLFSKDDEIIVQNFPESFKVKIGKGKRAQGVGLKAQGRRIDIHA